MPAGKFVRGAAEEFWNLQFREESRNQLRNIGGRNGAAAEQREGLSLTTNKVTESVFLWL